MLNQAFKKNSSGIKVLKKEILEYPRGMQWICPIYPRRPYFIHGLLYKIRCCISPKLINCKMVSLHRLPEWNRHFYSPLGEISLLCLSPFSTWTATANVSIGRGNRVPRAKLCCHSSLLFYACDKMLPKNNLGRKFLGCCCLFFSPPPYRLQSTMEREKSG